MTKVRNNWSRIFFLLFLKKIQEILVEQRTEQKCPVHLFPLVVPPLSNGCAHVLVAGEPVLMHHY